MAYIVPTDRFGNRYTLDPFFTKLTGITEQNIDSDGLSISQALAGLDAFSDGAR